VRAAAAGEAAAGEAAADGEAAIDAAAEGAAADGATDGAGVAEPLHAPTTRTSAPKRLTNLGVLCI
jgi:hypothetical protein